MSMMSKKLSQTKGSSVASKMKTQSQTRGDTKQSHQQEANKKVSAVTSSGSNKPKTGILHKTKVISYNVYYRGQDVTPKPLKAELFRGGKERQLNVVSMTKLDTSTTKLDTSNTSTQQQFKSSSAGRFKTEMHATTDFNKSLIGGKTFESTFFLQSIVTEGTDEEKEGGDTESDIHRLEISPSSYKIADSISLIMNETETCFILDIPSSSEIKGTKEGDKVEERNLKYEYLTEGKGKNRKVIEAMVQTHDTLRKSRETDAVKIKKTSHATFASNWEMYDTYREEQNKDPGTSEEVVSLSTGDQLHGLNSIVSVESLRQSMEEKQMMNMIKSENFQQAVTIIERLLANNNYNEKQKRFKGLNEVDAFKNDIEYNYRLDLLWTFSNDFTQGKSVTALSWNPLNEDIVVVAYGKFYFSDRITGLVAVWNIKNPVQPERHYFYEESVSAVACSNIKPHLIAVGFNNGTIEVIDIRERNLTVTNRSARDKDSSYETVNYLTFYAGDEHFNYEEQILACFNDGRVCKYRLTLSLMPFIQIMRTPEADGKIKGISTMAVCGVPAIPLTKYTGALILTFHPEDPNIYYICSDTGVIHKCSTNYYNQHLDLLLAHDGPIYQMQFSPFCNKLYVTCGGDWYIRIWAEGITEPLLELVTKMFPVQCVLWSPTHSTILVAAQSSEIQIWDLHRKVHYPQNTIQSPHGNRNSDIKFTSNGRCLTVCDVEGNTHIFSLENMPLPPFFQDTLLFSAIKKNLITKPALLKKFLALINMDRGESVTSI